MRGGKAWARKFFLGQERQNIRLTTENQQIIRFTTEKKSKHPFYYGK